MGFSPWTHKESDMTERLTHTFIPTVQEGSLLTPFPAFIVCRFFDDGYSDWFEVISLCSLDLHFSNNE